MTAKPGKTVETLKFSLGSRDLFTTPKLIQIPKRFKGLPIDRSILFHKKKNTTNNTTEVVPGSAVGQKREMDKRKRYV